MKKGEGADEEDPQRNPEQGKIVLYFQTYNAVSFLNESVLFESTELVINWSNKSNYFIPE